MKKIIVLLFLLLVAVPAMPAVLSWSPADTYEDSTPITPALQVQEIFYTYYALGEFGTWTQWSITPAGASSTQVPEPPAGVTYWYTIETELAGLRSVKAAPVSKTGPFPSLSPPKAPRGLAVQ